MIAEVVVDLAAIARNAAALARVAAPARLAAVVKANAYGHGLVPVARAVAPHAAKLCVYGVEEAVALREAGIDAPIHVLGPIVPDDLEAAHDAGVEITLWDRGAYAQQAASVARRRGAPFAVQAKIDTGVARYGMPYDEARGALAVYAATQEFVLAGAFSHLAAVEERDEAFTREQTRRFAEATARLAPGVERHLAATAATVLFPETRFDLVRCGIGLYGGRVPGATSGVGRPALRQAQRDVGALRQAQDDGDWGRVVLEAALTWTTSIVALHEVAAGESVGYGRAWRAERGVRIATIPVGYAEGLPRAASNRASVLVRAKAVPIVGRVCMDAAFLDVTGVPHAAVGDRVTLIGRDGDARVEAAALAEACGTIDYELFARLPAHVPRSYGVIGT